MRTLVSILRTAGLLLFGLAAAGCSNSVGPTGDIPPVAFSPVNATTRLVWSWNHREIDTYASMLSADFEFVGLAGDSTGSIATLWMREAELVAIERMLNRSPSLPYLDRLSVTFEPTRIDQPDPRPGKDPRFHRRVLVSMAVAADGNVGFGNESVLAQVPSAFYLVRGDSVVIPPDQLALGVQPDSTVWWVERWEDAASPLLPGGASPRRLTLATLKSYFRAAR